MAIVFLSSTFEDLEAHRDEVLRKLARMGQQSSAMENFGSRSTDALSVCTKEIDSCQIFVGVYAWRYGWVPDGETRSITEQEFDYARKRGKDCLVYLIDGDPPTPEESSEVAEAEARLSAFKEKVSRLVVSRFDTLALKCKKTILCLIKNHRKLLVQSLFL